jgi:glycolate oxidase FAD binding subunit
MDRVTEYSAGDLYISLESGIRLKDVNSFVADDRLRFVFGDCGYTGTIGGAVALGLTARLDPESVPVKRWVTSLAFVTAYGKHLKVGAVTLKSVAGYDITRLLVGSMGRLGFITSVTLRLMHESQAREFAGMALDIPETFSPSWRQSSSGLPAVERNLKRNFDPNDIFPSP